MAVGKPSVGKTGNAKIMKAGHTSSNRDGSNPRMQEKQSAVREEGIK